MPVPDLQTYFQPILKLMSDGETRQVGTIVSALANQLRLSQVDLSERVPNGTKTRHYDRVTWAATHLTRAHLLSRPSRGWYQITERGTEVASRGEAIDITYLLRYPEYQEFRSGDRAETGIASNFPSERGLLIEGEVTPEESVRSGHQLLRTNLAIELMELVKASSPSFFEQLVIDLLVAMGYGGSRVEASRRVGQSGDDGVDGVINEDRLGLDVINVLAKRWQGSEGSSVVRDFSGSPELHGATRGVLITTGHFTRDAINTVEGIKQKRTVLIDGERLAQLMIEFNVGVSVRERLEIKKIDEDYFSGE